MFRHIPWTGRRLSGRRPPWFLMTATGVAAICAMAAAQTASPPRDHAYETLGTALRRALDENRTSYQRFLWRAYHLVRPALSEQDWRLVQPSLKVQGFQIQEESVSSAESRYTVRLPGVTFVMPSGIRCPL